jgi:hypothetical protein
MWPALFTLKTLMVFLYLTRLFYFQASFIYLFLVISFFAGFSSQTSHAYLYMASSFFFASFAGLSSLCSQPLCTLQGSHCPDFMLCKVPWFVSIWPAFFTLKSLPACLLYVASLFLLCKLCCLVFSM